MSDGGGFGSGDCGDALQVLVVDDEPSARELVGSIFEVGGWPAPVQAVDGQCALNTLRDTEIDILVTDLDMPRMGGDELIRRALGDNPDLTVLVMTGHGTIDRAVDLLKVGVFDFICKPFEVDRFLISMGKARERVLNLSDMRGIRDVVGALMAALESKDPYLEGHSSRVSTYAVGLGALVGLGRRELRSLEYASLLHDVGKIGIHEDILSKSGALTPEEYGVIKQHPTYSRDILAPVAFLKPCLPGVLHHHERVDGKGYPGGLVGDDIPLEAKIIAVVDSFDAMNSRRSYRDALPLGKVLHIMEDVSGTQLDSEICGLFLEHFEEITGIEMPVKA